MTWRDEYQPGSFRGASFVTQRHERTGGRRSVTYEFPGRDEPATEDLGRRAREFVIDCFVNGPAYFADRDALLDALEAEGPGLLVHPWHGTMLVVVKDYRSSEDTDEGGMARFSILFAESGAQPSTEGVSDTAGLAAAEADAVAEAAAEEFADAFSIDDAAAFVEDAAADLVEGAAFATSLIAAAQGGIGPTLRAFQAGLQFLPDNIAGLLRAPLQLGLATVGLVQAVSALGGTPRQKIAGFSKLADHGATLKPVFGVTPARRKQRANQAAFVQLFAGTAAAEMVRAAARVKFASHDDAVQLRERIAGQLDRLALEQSDLGRDDRAEIFDRLRRATVRDINRRGASLARVQDLPLGQTQPALVIAHRLYGPDRVESLAGDVVARNAVRHPGFIGGGRTIRVLSGDARDAA